VKGISPDSTSNRAANPGWPPALLQIEQAKEVCRRCDVVDACLQWALDTGQDAGVCGGMSDDERRLTRRRLGQGRRRREAQP
jgi:WhiB family transcriptional regulator, redox-sensing transcriptional regulator